MGKSSLINGLVGRKVVSVSRTPGHTRYFQTYFLTPSVKLCDCPGLIFPSLLPRQLQVGGQRGQRGREGRGFRKVLSALVSSQILAGIYPIAQIQEPYTAVGYLASRIPVQVLLHLRHPEAEDPSAEHPWCAWDICEGRVCVPGFSPRPISSPLLRGPAVDGAAGHSFLDFCLRASKISGLECSGEN